MRAEIVSIGNEVLMGWTINRNAAYLGMALSEYGCHVRRHTVLPDEIDAIRMGLQEALNRAEIVVVTGGLGPTVDDVTLEAALPLFKEKVFELKNSLGTAPGKFGSGLILLPGVPREMERMFSEEVLPLLKMRYPQTNSFYSARCTLGLLKELQVDPFLRKIHRPGLEIGIYPSYGALNLFFRSVDPVDPIVTALSETFPTYFMGNQSVEEAVRGALTQRGMTLALAESCTGGAIASRLVSIPDASMFLSGSIVAYSNHWKERFLGVRKATLASYGAVSREVVEEMLYGLFQTDGSDAAIAVSGILGPKGGSDQKSVGTVFVGVALRGEATDIGEIRAPLDRKGAIEFTVQTALAALWRRIVHKKATFS